MSNVPVAYMCSIMQFDIVLQRYKFINADADAADDEVKVPVAGVQLCSSRSLVLRYNFISLSMLMLMQLMMKLKSQLQVFNYAVVGVWYCVITL